jgi:DNA-binding MarR family transcriptional regulator
MQTSNLSDIDKILENLFTIHPLVSRALMRRTRDKVHLSPGSLYILWLIYKHEILSMTEISQKLGMPKPNVTALVDKLVNENIVERVLDPNDRRIINIRMTEKGLEDLQIIKRSVGREMRERIQTLSEDKRNKMLEYTGFLRDTLSEIMKDYVPGDEPLTE